MKFTQTEIEWLIYLLKWFIGISGTLGMLFFLTFLKMISTLNDIKTALGIQTVKHENLEKEHKELKDFIFKNQN